jgi:signal peptidase II
LIRLGLALAAAVLGLDQLTKWLARGALWEPKREIRLTGFLNLTPVENRGISFGLMQSEAGYGPWLIAGLAILVAIGLLLWLARTKRLWPALALGLVVGGALGNVVDRARLGWVIDFVDLHAGRYHWPAFNLGDAAITVGVAILLFDALLRPAKRTR